MPRVLGATVAILVLIATGMAYFVSDAARLAELGRDGGHLIGRALLAIVLIVAVGKVAGWIARRLGQPGVIGEMVAGIALGPSLFGYVAPHAQQWLFPPVLTPHLGLIAGLTVTVFVFLLGANLPLALLRGSGGRVTALGVGMVAIPVLCGVALAAGLARAYQPDEISLVPFLLFVGVAMGVTAFPVLVRILDEHGLTRTRIGALGLTAAAIGDAIAWFLLLVAVAAIDDGSGAVAVRTVALVVVFAAFVYAVLRPALRQFLMVAEKNVVARVAVAPVLLLSAVSAAAITDRIGVHAIFGAFMAGLAVPRDSALIRNFTGAVERGVALVLPLFFAMIGLSVQIGFLGNLRDLLVCGLVLVVAMSSKMVTTVLIARLTKLNWRDSLGLGVMMNCRGLTELVVITTGLSLGIIGPDLFAIFVAMTLVTTIMTGPILRRLTLNEERPGSAAPGPRPHAVTTASVSD